MIDNIKMSDNVISFYDYISRLKLMSINNETQLYKNMPFLIINHKTGLQVINTLKRKCAGNYKVINIFYWQYNRQQDIIHVFNT